jgi:hypothetical protein
MTFKCSVCGVDQCTMEVPGLNDNMNDTTYCNVLGAQCAQWEPEEDMRK